MRIPLRPVVESMSDRCPRCDRAECGVHRNRDAKYQRGIVEMAQMGDCVDNAVDWRARALAAEQVIATGKITVRMSVTETVEILLTRMWCHWFAEAWRAIGYAEAAYVQLEDAIAAYNRQRK